MKGTLVSLKNLYKPFSTWQWNAAGHVQFGASLAQPDCGPEVGIPDPAFQSQAQLVLRPWVPEILEKLLILDITKKGGKAFLYT